MKLNIHLISHPIIRDLSDKSHALSITPNNNYQASKYLGMLIIYETIRSLIKTYSLRIKKTSSKKNILLMDPKENYTIIFDSLYNLSLFHEVKFLIPQTTLKLIKHNELKLRILDLDSETFNLYTKIIIVNYKFNIDYIKTLIKILINTKSIKLHQVYLACIECETEQLVQISQNEIYKNLQIYTTQIINN